MKTQSANPAADSARQLPHTLVLEERKRLTVSPPAARWLSAAKG